MLLHDRLSKDIIINSVIDKFVEFFRFKENDFQYVIDDLLQNNIEPKEVFLLKDYENNKENSNVNLDWR